MLVRINFNSKALEIAVEFPARTPRLLLSLGSAARVFTLSAPPTTMRAPSPLTSMRAPSPLTSLLYYYNKNQLNFSVIITLILL